MRLKQTYSSREVASLTGLTARQLQLWDEGGLVAAAIPSHLTEAGGRTERRYTPIALAGSADAARGILRPLAPSLIKTPRDQFSAGC